MIMSITTIGLINQVLRLYQTNGTGFYWEKSITTFNQDTSMKWNITLALKMRLM